MKPSETRNVQWKIAVISAAILALLALAVAVGHAAGSDGAALDRKVGIMARVLDEVLAQSPNVAVGPMRTTRGLVLPGWGALLTFDASLGIEPGLFVLPEGFTFGGSASRRPMKFERPDGPDGEEPQLLVLDEAERAKEREKNDQRRRERIAGLTRELTDALLDYGPTLAELGDGERVAVAAFLDDIGVFSGRAGRVLMLTATMRDLRACAGGQLSREAAAAKIVVTQRDAR